MSDQENNTKEIQAKETQRESVQGNQPRVMDAVRHVGRTLESEGVYLPSGELPENVIADEGLVEDTINMRAVTADQYDRKAEAMGAEPLRTRLPGDTSSDPHTNVGPDNATTLDDDRPHQDPSHQTRTNRDGRNVA